MKIVFASHTAQVGVFRVGSHHLSREMALAGHDVVHISSPVTLAHLLRLRDSDVRARFTMALRAPTTDRWGVAHAIPFVPLPFDRVPAMFSAWTLRRPLNRWRSVISSVSPVDVLFIDQPSLVDLVDSLQPRVVIYRPTDAHFDAYLRGLEKRVLVRADAVVATSQVVLDEVTKEMTTRPASLVLENGVEFSRFRRDRSDARAQRSGVVYLGALDKRFGWDALAAMSGAFPHVPFKIAGPVPSQPVPDLPANVQLLGPVPYEKAADLLNAAQVGILPFSADRGNDGRSPMKYFEYLASGLSVVASASPTLVGRQAPNVWLFETPEESVRALGSALSATSPNEEGIAFAENFSWAVRAQTLAKFAGAVLQAGRPS